MTNGPITTAAHLVWGERGTGNVLHPLSGTYPAGQFKKVRVALEMFQRQGDLNARAYYATSDDGKVFTNGATVLASLTADGVNVSSFVDLTSLIGGSRFVRFGVIANNTLSSDLNTAYVALRIEGRDY